MKTNKRFPRFARNIFGTVLLGCLLSLPAAMSQAGLTIMPIRTIFVDGDRMKGIMLANTSAEPSSYRVAFLHQKQLFNGAYSIQKEPLNPKYDLEKMLVYSPRQVNLEPQSTQSIRMSIRRPADLPDGEYRVHLAVKQLPSPKKVKEREEARKRMQSRVHVSVGFAVPVILRKGKYDTTATLSGLKFSPLSVKDGKEQSPRVDLFIDRKGKYSALGKLLVYWTPAGGGKEELVGTKENVHIFPELDRRSAFISLENKTVSGGQLRVVFQGEDADKERKFDEEIFTIGG